MSSRKQPLAEDPAPDDECAFDKGCDPEEIEEEEAAYEYDMLGHVMNAVLTGFFQYQHSDGSTLNIADILLYIKQSIDKNTEIQHKVYDRLLTLLPSTSAQPGQQSPQQLQQHQPQPQPQHQPQPQPQPQPPQQPYLQSQPQPQPQHQPPQQPYLQSQLQQQLPQQPVPKTVQHRQKNK